MWRAPQPTRDSEAGEGVVRTGVAETDIPMRRFWRCLLVCLPVLVCILLVAALLEPNQIMVGLVLGDDFHDGRPTRYWREILKREGEAGKLSENTVASFRFRGSGAPVLRMCACDGDRNVRWPAVFLLGRLARHQNYLAVPALRQALTDEDREVQLQAIIGLGNLGANAMNASPELVVLLKAPEPQVAFLADKALWFVNKNLAIKECGWQIFESPRWAFSASFPGPPLEAQQPAMLAADKLTVHSFLAERGVLSCVVAITEYPPDLFNGTDEERLDAARDMVLFGLGANLVDDRAIELGNLKGRESRRRWKGKVFRIRRR
jgi:HEAT repeats